MPDINIRLKVTDDGSIQLLDQAGEKVAGIGKSAEQSGGGFASFTSGMADVKAGLDLITSAIREGAGALASINELGTATIRAKESFETMAGGAAVGDLNAMRDATKGLVSDLKLSADGAFAIASGAAHSKKELEDLARDGATLGIALGKDAVSGIDDLTRALESVGNVRPLRGLGIDAVEVKAEYDKLKESMSDESAWHLAVFDAANKRAQELSGSLSSAGTAVERLGVRWDNLKASFAEKISIEIDTRLNFIDWLGQQRAKDTTPMPDQMEFDPNGIPVTQSPTVEKKDQRINFQQGASGQGIGYDRAPGYGGFGPVTGNDPNFNPQTFIPSIYSPSGGADVDEHNQRAKNARLNYGTMDLESDAGDKLGKFFQTLHDGVNNVFATIDQIDAASRGFSSLRDAFGLQSGGIGGELGSNMGGVEGVARQNFIDQERKKGIGGKRLDTDVAAFDDHAKKAMDDYAVATGQATRESIALRDAKANLDSAVEKGSITWDQYSRSVLALANAARDGQTSMRDLYTLMKAAPDMTSKYQGWLGISNLDNPATTSKHLTHMYNEGGFSEDGTAPGKKMADPMAAQKQSIADVQGSLNKLPAAAQTAANQMAGPATQMQTQLSWVTSEAGKALGNINAIPSALRAMVGTLTISVGMTGGDGGRNGPSSSGWQGGQHAGAGGV